MVRLVLGNVKPSQFTTSFCGCTDGGPHFVLVDLSEVDPVPHVQPSMRVTRRLASLITLRDSPWPFQPIALVRLSMTLEA